MLEDFPEPSLILFSEKEKLYLGNYKTANDLTLLNTLAIKSIVNVALAQVPNFFPRVFTYKSKELSDLPDEEISETFNELVDFIEEALTRGPVFVHCAGGVSRSATIVIAFLMKKKQMCLKDAYAHVKEKRPIIAPNGGFLIQLLEYEMKLFGKTTMEKPKSIWARFK